MYLGDSIVCFCFWRLNMCIHPFIHISGACTPVWLYASSFVCVYGIMELFFWSQMFSVYGWINQRLHIWFTGRFCLESMWSFMLSSKPRQLANDLHSLIRSQTVSCLLWSPQLTHTHSYSMVTCTNSPTSSTTDPETLGYRCLVIIVLHFQWGSKLGESKSVLTFWQCSCRKLVSHVCWGLTRL